MFSTSCFPASEADHFTMDKVIDGHFERVEKALATLINSISTFNPSPALANDLVAADAELSEGLEKCEHNYTHSDQLCSLCMELTPSKVSIHQINHSKI